MRFLAALVFAAVVPMLGSCRNVPQRVDFSGEWHFNRGESRLGLENLVGLEEAVLQIEHREPAFKLRRTFVLGGQESHASFELASDGREVVRDEGERKLSSRLYWEGDALIFTTRITDSAGEGLNRVVYRLFEDGHVLQAEERFQSPDLSYENRWVFDKR